jgi:NAD(P)-dependent dehydrogenase (short-subunit alcohol dehydrogenase family)
VNPPADGLFALDGDVAVVTGGASGFGRAIAAALADRGCKTAILDRDEAGALAAADEVGCLGIAADVRDRDAVAAAWQQVTGQLGPPGLLVNSAGIGGWSAALGYPGQLWQDVIDINLTGTLNCCLVAAESMAASGGGAIVNMASVMGEIGFPGLVGYAASKGGVIQVTRALAVEFATNGIRVNAVAPSTFDTPLALGNRALRPEVYERLRQRTPLGRFGQIGEIVGPVLFLLSRAASMVTGHVLAVDGGYLAS